MVFCSNENGLVRAGATTSSDHLLLQDDYWVVVSVIILLCRSPCDSQGDPPA